MRALRDYIENINESSVEGTVKLPKFEGNSVFTQNVIKFLQEEINKANQSINANKVLETFMTEEQLNSYSELCKNTQASIDFASFASATKKLLNTLKSLGESMKDSRNVESFKKHVDQVATIVNWIYDDLGEDFQNKIKEEPYISLINRKQFTIYTNDLDDADRTKLEELVKTSKMDMTFKIKDEAINILFN